MYGDRYYANRNFANADKSAIRNYFDPRMQRNVRIHTLGAGDTLPGIAARYQITVERILQANPRLDPYQIFIGQRLRIPVSSPEQWPTQTPLTQIVRKVLPSIVGIRLVKVDFDKFVRTRMDSGSGVIIRKDGYIVTNYHVMKGADPRKVDTRNIFIIVTLSGKSETKAKYVGSDPETDLAVIKIDGEDLPAAELGDASQLELGELVVAIGTPSGETFTFANSVTVGIISGLNRTDLISKERRTDYIQTDAAINPGNSGGALVNCQGQVIGINSWGIERKEYQNIGFAIPLNEKIKKIINQLIEYGKVKGRLLLGIDKIGVIDEFRAQTGSIPMGIIVGYVIPKSDAAKAGIQDYDIITGMAGGKIRNFHDLDDITRKYKVGDTVDVEIFRVVENKYYNLKLTFTKET
jgi:serine protease Do